MGILTKNIPKAEQDLSNVPLGLQIRRKNAVKAGYTFEFDKKEKSYITYNKLRTERPDQEIVQVAKVYRLKNRDNNKEFLVWYQTSKTYDYEGNLVKCPHVEKIGVENAPQTTKHKNSQNQITDIELVETQNDFYEPYTEDKIKQIFQKSRNSQNIACYVGYCKPVQEIGTDYITDKRRINNQVAFMFDDFEELIQMNDKNNVVNTYSKVKKKLSNQKNNQQEEEEEKNNDGLMTEEEYNESLQKKIDDNELPKVASTGTIVDKPAGKRRSNRLASASTDVDQDLEKQEEEHKQQEEANKQKNQEELEQETGESDTAEVDSEENDDNGEEESSGGNEKKQLKIGSTD